MSACSVAPQEPRHGHPSPAKEAGSGLGSGGRSGGTALPGRAAALHAGLRDHPRSATADTAQEPETAASKLGFLSPRGHLQAYLQERRRMLTGCLSRAQRSAS